MSKLHYYIIIVAISGFFLACGSKSGEEEYNPQIDLSDAVVQQIFDLRNKRNAEGNANTEALKTYLTVENPNHRYAAAMVLASLQDSAVVPALLATLKDPNSELRYRAAFALGLTKNNSAVDGLLQCFREDSLRRIQGAVLEAIGRCGRAEELQSMCISHPYPMQDTQLWVGLALGLYRFSQRNMVQKEGTSRIINEFIAHTAMPAEARFVAANYLARVPGLDLGIYENVLLNAVREEKDPNILMFLVLGLAKTKTIKAFEELSRKFYSEKDYRVRSNILRGLQYFLPDSTRPILADALYDTSTLVRMAAAEHLYQFGNNRDALLYWEWADAHPHWWVKAKLAAAALRHLDAYKGASKAFISTKTIERLRSSENTYEKIELISALGNYAWNYRLIGDMVFPKSDTIKVAPVLVAAGATALVGLYSSENFERDLSSMSQRVREELHLLFRRFIEGGDVGAIAVISELICNPKFKFKQVYPDYSFLVKARNQLSLPRDIETYLYLQKAIDYLSDKNTKVGGIGKNNFVDVEWPLLNSLPPAPKVAIHSNRGRIVLELLPQDAPATVFQFIQLVKTGYYNEKTFHRIVPNFVAQGGCPRGDGWGGFEVTVVSEFSDLRYTQEGRVGMASAGKDTEGVQFFITHSPAIHLDGNYTIFAQVVEGMSVVHLLEPGDVMEKVELLF